MLIGVTTNDVISRCILYAQFFDGDIQTDQKLFHVNGADKDGFYRWSGVLRRRAPKDEDVHVIGCEIAAGQNKNKGEPLSGPNRRYYCGFRSAGVKDIQMTGYLYHFELENDRDAHVDVRLKVHAQDKNERGTIRTEALMAIAEVFGEPTPHTCACDEGDPHHPFAVFGERCLHGERRDT